MKKFFSIIFVVVLTSALHAQTLEIYNGRGKKVKTYKAEDIAFVEPFAYALNVSIVGPGNVNEFLVEGNSLEPGSKVNLKATPMYGTQFLGWEGDLTGNNPDTTVIIDGVKYVIAKFGVEKVPLPNLKQPSHYLGKIYDIEIPINYEDVIMKTYGCQNLLVDYNKDGYLDLVVTPTNYGETDRFFVDFYIGKENGSFIKDEMNSGRIIGPNNSRKLIYGDYNNDDYPDICIIAHGYDAEPWPGEYPIILLSSPSGYYTDIRFEDYVAFYHGGTSGDFDNDGDLDIFLTDAGSDVKMALILENDGYGNFTPRTDLINQDLLRELCNTEFFDFNHDGYLDLIVGGHDMFGVEVSQTISNTPIIIWGNGKTFNTDDYVRLPEFCVNGYGVVGDFYFYDLDKDGEEEIIISRTGDGSGFGGSTLDFYAGSAIQILKKTEGEYLDMTEKLCDIYLFPEGNFMPWIDVQEIDGEIKLLGIEGSISIINSWTLTNGKFILDQKQEEVDYNDAGFVFDFDYWFTNSIVRRTFEVSHSGGSSIEWTSTEEWQWLGKDYYDDPIGKEELNYWIANDYTFEMFVKVPEEVSLNVTFRSEDIRVEKFFELKQYPKDENGWHKIQIPLSAFDKHDGEYVEWSKVSICFASAGPINQPIYLDDIRIRKIL